MDNLDFFDVLAAAATVAFPVSAGLFEPVCSFSLNDETCFKDNDNYCILFGLVEMFRIIVCQVETDKTFQACTIYKKKQNKTKQNKKKTNFNKYICRLEQATSALLCSWFSCTRSSMIQVKFKFENVGFSGLGVKHSEQG